MAGVNTYTGSTTIKGGGVLQVDGSITSDTFVGGTLTGTGVIGGAVANHGTVSPGDGAPGTLVVSSYTQATGNGNLMVDIAGTSASEFSVLNVLGDASSRGFLDPVLLGGFMPTIGEQFTFLKYGSFSGAFQMQNGGIFANGMERWVVTYEPTEAILTATAFTPDLGSTGSLLGLSFLAIAAYHTRIRNRHYA